MVDVFSYFVTEAMKTFSVESELKDERKVIPDKKWGGNIAYGPVPNDLFC